MSGTKQRLVETARDLFLARGYNVVGTNEICSAAGINKGTFYHFYKSKADLALDALSGYGDEFAESFVRIVNSRAVPVKKLQHIFDIPYKANQAWQEERGYAQGCLVGNLSLELSAIDERVRKQLSAIMSQWSTALTPLVEELIHSGDIPRINARQGAVALVSFLQGLILMAKTCNDPKIIKRFSKGALGLLQGL